MLASEGRCVKLEAAKRLSSFISLASWAVAAGTARCEVLKEWVKSKRQAHTLLCTTYRAPCSHFPAIARSDLYNLVKMQAYGLGSRPTAWPVYQGQNWYYQFFCYACTAPGGPLFVLPGSLVSGVLPRNTLSLAHLEHIQEFSFWWRMK